MSTSSKLEAEFFLNPNCQFLLRAQAGDGSYTMKMYIATWCIEAQYMYTYTYTYKLERRLKESLLEVNEFGNIFRHKRLHQLQARTEKTKLHTVFFRTKRKTGILPGWTDCK